MYYFGWAYVIYGTHQTFCFSIVVMRRLYDTPGIRSLTWLAMQPGDTWYNCVVVCRLGWRYAVLIYIIRCSNIEASLYIHVYIQNIRCSTTMKPHNKLLVMPKSYVIVCIQYIKFSGSAWTGAQMSLNYQFGDYFSLTPVFSHLAALAITQPGPDGQLLSMKILLFFLCPLWCKASEIICRWNIFAISQQQSSRFC